MPGIDGWETIRRIHGQKIFQPKIAIVSANAFDKELENDAGIPPEDFILKPVQVDEFIEWIGQRLDIEWLFHEPAAELAGSAALHHTGLDYPSGAILRELAELVAIGYVRGILKKIEEIEAAGQLHAEFVQLVRGFVGQFQLDALSRLIKEGLAGAEKYS
jgi:CheY-like chemotaxis protein